MHLISDSSYFYPEQPWFIFNATKEYFVSLSKDPSISHYYSFQVADADSATLAVPDGCVDIIIDCDPIRPSARLCGSPLEARSFNLTRHHHYFGVRFSPGYVPRLSRISPRELKDQEIDLTEVIKDGDEILEKIVKNHSFMKNCELFDCYLSRALSCQPSALTMSAIGIIKHQRGNVSVRALEDKLFCTERTIQRQFKEDTGMSPKVFSRILRCQSALRLLEEHSERSITDVALDLGFSDQSHFQREFKSLINTTPLEFIKHLDSAGFENKIQRIQ